MEAESTSSTVSNKPPTAILICLLTRIDIVREDGALTVHTERDQVKLAGWIPITQCHEPCPTIRANTDRDHRRGHGSHGCARRWESARMEAETIRVRSVGRVALHACVEARAIPAKANLRTGKS